MSKDPVTNVVFVSRRYYSEDKARRSFRAGGFSWVGGSPPADLDQRELLCKVRHGPRFHKCTLRWDDAEISGPDADEAQQIGDAQDRVLITLAEDDQGLAAGQYVAMYVDGYCAGSGVILEAIDEGGSDHVSPEARQAALTVGEVDLKAFAKYQAGAKGRKNKKGSESSRPVGGLNSLVGLKQLQTTKESDQLLLRS